MKANIDAIRAITAVVFQRIFKPFVWVIVGVGIVCILLVSFLGIFVHAWWWLLLVVLVPVTVVLAALGYGAWHLSRRLIPRPINAEEHKRLNEISERVIRVAEVRATPVPVLLLYIAKDVVRNKRSSYIESVVTDTSSLKQDFIDARRMFTRHTE